MRAEEHTRDSRRLPNRCDADSGSVAKRNGHDSRRSVRLRTLDDLDGRTRAAKLAQRLVAGLEADLGGGDALSVGTRELIKRAALLGAIVEDCEVRWLERKPVDLAEYLAAVNSQRRVLATIGLDRRPRDITPDPLTYAQQRAEAGP